MKNHSSGLEHGYTLQKRTGSLYESDQLVLNLQVRGDLNTSNVSDDGQNVTFGSNTNPSLLTYSGLKVFDAEGRNITAKITSDGKDSISIVVEDQRVNYPLTIDPLIRQQAYIKASNTGAYDTFGSSVAIS